MQPLERTWTELLEHLRQSGRTEVRVIFLDYNGLARARSLPVDRLPAILAHGVNFSSPTVDFNSRDAFPPSAAFDLASPDFWARPDPATCRPAPCAAHAADILADLVDARGEPWEGCPRAALRRAVDRAAGRNLTFMVGFEPEGYVFRPISGELGFVGPPAFATLEGLDLESDFMRDLLRQLADVGVEVVQWSEEYGPGQFEINLQHAPALDAADTLVRFRQAFRAVARQHGLQGTFMPKPFERQAGSGLHVHLSAAPLDNQAGNLFDDPGDAELGLSGLGRHALAGLLAHGEALTALGASTVNSYKRFQPGSWAPTHIVYAYASRAAFVRVPERETPRRLELRVGDAAGNPYLYLTGILAAIVDGIDRALDPGSPAPGDVGALSAAAAASRQLRSVPATLDEALGYLANDTVICEALGALISGEFIKIKRSEWDAFRLHVGEWDRKWYLERY